MAHDTNSHPGRTIVIKWALIISVLVAAVVITGYEVAIKQKWMYNQVIDLAPGKSVFGFINTNTRTEYTFEVVPIGGDIEFGFGHATSRSQLTNEEQSQLLNDATTIRPGSPSAFNRTVDAGLYGWVLLNSSTDKTVSVEMRIK